MSLVRDLFTRRAQVDTTPRARHAPVRASGHDLAAEVDRTDERRRAAPSTARTRDRCACGRDESHPSAWLEPRGRGLLLFCDGCADPAAALIPTKGR